MQVLVVATTAIGRMWVQQALDKSRAAVLGTADTLPRAIEAIKLFQPSVVVIRCGGIDLLFAVKRITEEFALPIVVVGQEQDHEILFDAMRAGAVDFSLVSQPAELTLKVVAASIAHPAKYTVSRPRRVRIGRGTSAKVLCIATSTGGPPTLERLLTELPEAIPIPILIVQHMPPGFTKSFADRLDSICKVRVREAQDGDLLENGVVLFAPGGQHMEVVPGAEGRGPSIRLTTEPYEESVRPCANKLFRSAAKVFGGDTIGVVLTGMGKDGLDGSRAIREAQGTILAQSEESCVVFGMPKEVISAGYADEILPIETMAVALLQLIEQ